MKSIWNRAAVLLAGAALATLTACGGGGGGSSTAAGGDKSGDGGATPALAVSVKVNGQAGLAQGDSYLVKAGDTVEITPNQSVTWSSSSAPAGVSPVALLDSPTQWRAQLANATLAPATFTVSASAGGASKAAVFVVAGGDARNASYKAFATNGTRQALALDFDTGSYSWTDADNTVLSGNFSADANEPGTYIFQSSRITTAINTARFHLAHDTVVGAFPFRVTQATDVRYEIQAFIASRALETQQAALDGVYNRFAIDVGPTTQTSNISQFQISNGGTQLVRCDDAAIPTVGLCNPAARQAWTIAPGSTSGMWTMTEVANPANTANIAFALIGGQRVLLIAGKSFSDPYTASFRIGVPESTDWPAGTGYGASTSGSWGVVQISASNTSTRTGVYPDGRPVQTFNTFTSLNPNQPTGMRTLPGDTGGFFFAMQGAKIFAIVGTPGTGTPGYLQLNLMD